MQNIAARYNPYIFLDRNRERTVVYYGRVSTEHEAQLAALENQLQWYDDQTERHSNWNVLQKYIDEGITGTQAKKRPAFLRMLEDARAGKFDLIVTREVCRFARNTVDTLVTTRELKNLGIEVYFVEDNIWTMDGDGELRLTIMATLAQEESRKVSERVRAGQKISRENGVLYGNGNIIGYDRVGSTYVINEEQAETVRIIFDLYLQGAGQTKIAKELCRLGRKDGHGQVSWSASKIGRILHNATYKGYNCYLKSFSNNYLEQKRIKNLDEETYMYVKGDFEPIVSEEIWDKCSEIRKARTTKMIVNKGERTYGKKSTQDVWLRKLRCSCGSTFRKNKWRTNKRGDEVFGYQCYNQVNNGSKAFREKNGLDTEGYCDIRMVGDWKLEIMAKKIFEGIWTEQERKDAILEVYRLLNEYYQSDTKNNQAAASALEGKIARLKNKIDNLISMRADGEITKEEFKSLKDTTEAELNKYMEEKARMSELSNSESGMEFDTEKIRAVLEEALDFSKPKLDDSIIEKFVSQIIPVDNCRYRWDLNFLPNETQSLVCKVEGRKNHADATIEEGSEDEDESPRTYVLSMDYSNISVTAKNAYQSYVLHIQKIVQIAGKIAGLVVREGGNARPLGDGLTQQSGGLNPGGWDIENVVALSFQTAQHGMTHLGLSLPTHTSDKDGGGVVGAMLIEVLDEDIPAHQGAAERRDGRALLGRGGLRREQGLEKPVQSIILTVWIPDTPNVQLVGHKLSALAVGLVFCAVGVDQQRLPGIGFVFRFLGQLHQGEIGTVLTAGVQHLYHPVGGQGTAQKEDRPGAKDGGQGFR